MVSTEALRTPEGCQRQMDRVFEFLGLPPFTLPDTAPRNTAKQVSVVKLNIFIIVYNIISLCY